MTAPPYETPFRYPPIFFVGAPRSGSTLMFQVITDTFDVAYLSNRHCQFFGAPALAERLFHPTRNRPPSDYRSNHGVTQGAHAPSECGQWWYRFFRRDPAYVTLDDVDEAKMRCFRRSLLAFTEVADKPVVFKNLYASLRLGPIARYIPEALFIIVQRNEQDNVHSILESRMKALGRYDQWWSVPPPNVDALKTLGPVQQAVEQVRSIHVLIANSFNSGAIKQNRFLTLQYEFFCADVHGALTQFEDFLSLHGVYLKRRFGVPTDFEMRNEIRIDSQLYAELLEITSPLQNFR